MYDPSNAHNINQALLATQESGNRTDLFTHLGTVAALLDDITTGPIDPYAAASTASFLRGLGYITDAETERMETLNPRKVQTQWDTLSSRERNMVYVGNGVLSILASISETGESVGSPQPGLNMRAKAVLEKEGRVKTLLKKLRPSEVDPTLLMRSPLKLAAIASAPTADQSNREASLPPTPTTGSLNLTDDRPPFRLQ